MKKLISAILTAAMVLSLGCIMTACDETTPDEPANNDSVSSVVDIVSDTAEGDDFPAALANIEAYEIPEIDNTGWTLAGGMFNGVEMEEADVNEVLEACGGSLQFIFLEEGKIQLVNGQKTFDGTYTVTNDGFVVDAVFDGYGYYGVFTLVEEETVFVVVNKIDSEKALYMTQIVG